MCSIFSSVIHVHLFNRRAIGAEGTMQGGSQTDTEEYNSRVSGVTCPPSSSNLGAGFCGSRACLSEHALKRKAHFYRHMTSDFQSLLPSTSSLPSASELNRTQECGSDQSPASIRSRSKREPPPLDQ